MIRTRKSLVALVALAGLALGGVAEAHVLTSSRAANANRLVTRAICESVVNDATLGTCTGWTSGPCRRVSPHRFRCPFTHKFDQEDGSQVLCRQVADWFIPNNSGTLKTQLVRDSTLCRQIRPPDPVLSPPG